MEPCLIAGVGGCVVATADPTGLSPGKYTATVTIASTAKNGPFVVPVEMDVVAAGPPVSYFQGVVDNALYAIGATVSPGDLVAVRGEQFTTGVAVAAQKLPLGTTLGGATVYVNGSGGADVLCGGVACGESGRADHVPGSLLDSGGAGDGAGGSQRQRDGADREHHQHAGGAGGATAAAISAET